ASRHHRDHVVAAVAVEDTAALRLGTDPLDGGDGPTFFDPASKRVGARPRIAQYHRVWPDGLCHRGRNSSFADTGCSYASRWRAWRIDGDQPLARALQRAERMALDLHVPGRP